jgi:D-sorbitol dehydrogenase (acceptor)
MPRLEGKVALITGAAGGLGGSLATAFAREGCCLFLSDIDPAGLRQRLEKLQATGAGADGLAGDLAQPDQRRAIVDGAIHKFGRIDILVNNAGVASVKSLWDLTESDWDAVLNVNVKGLFFMLQAVARPMVTNGGGSIINIASVAGRVGRPLLLHYAASKAAVISITRSCALALASSGVRVNAIAPGMIDTGMLQSLLGNWTQTPPGSGPPGKPANIPLGRVAQPEDIVGAAIFLASSEAGYVTGQTFNVDGGIVLS